MIILTAPNGERAEVHPFGAHLTRWCSASGDEGLYLSPRARLDGKTAIRGGIPVIFPQFAEIGPGPRHGFARTALWQRTDAGEASDRVTLRLRASDVTRGVWPHEFTAELRVRIGDGLEVGLSVENTDRRPFDFTCALHGYLRVEDVRQVEVEGLDGVAYLPRKSAETVRQRGSVCLEGETDRVYRDAPPEVRIHDAAGGRTFTLASQGFGDLVLWNPGYEAAAAVDDLGGDQFSRFVCVEPARITRPVRLEPGERWEGTQWLRLS